MKTLFDQNIDFMKEKMPQLYNVFEKRKNKADEKRLVKSIITNGYENILINGKIVHGSYNPELDGKMMTMVMENSEFDTIFVFGIGLGYHLNEISESFPHKNKIFYEPNFDVLKAFLEKKDLQEYFKKNVMIVLPDSKENILSSLINLFSSFVVYNVSFIGLPTYFAEYADEWVYITKGYVDYFSRYTVNLKTLIKYNNLWMLNFFKNLKHYPFESEFDDFKDKFRGIPGVVVSSGPSLKKNMHLLKGILDKAVVLSAGSSINALEANDITPHIMLAVDPSQLMSDEYNAVKNQSVLFAHILNVHYDCIERYQGPKLHFRVASELNMEYFEKKGSQNSTIVATGGSCANVAMDFLLKLGCDPIILIGQDLCFTGNVTHSEGVWDRKEITQEISDPKSELIKTKDVFGNEVYTNRVFNAIHKWFQDYIKANADAGNNIHVINATEGGLKIEGAENMSLQEVIAKYCSDEKNVKERINSLHIDSLEKSHNHIRRMKDFLKDTTDEMKALEKKSQSRLEIVRKAIKKLEKGNMDVKDLRKKMEKITIEMEKDEAFKYFIWLSSFEMIYNIKNTFENQAKEKRDMSQKLLTLYRGLYVQYGEIHIRIKLIKELALETMEEIKNIKEWADGDEFAVR